MARPASPEGFPTCSVEGMPDRVLRAAYEFYCERDRATRNTWSRSLFQAPSQSPGHENDEWHILSRIINSVEVCQAAAKFELGHRPSEEFWKEIIAEAVTIRVGYMSADQLTNRAKIRLLEQFIKQLAAIVEKIEEVKRISFPDATTTEAAPGTAQAQDLSAMSGTQEYYDKLYSETVEEDLKEFKEALARLRPRTYTGMFLEDLWSARITLQISKVDHYDETEPPISIRGHIEFFSLRHIANALISALRSKLAEVAGQPEVMQITKGDAPQRYAVLILEALFERHFASKLSTLHPGPNPLIAALINAGLGRSGNSQTTAEQVSEIRSYLSSRKKAL